jgi:hypothetical protein
MGSSRFRKPAFSTALPAKTRTPVSYRSVLAVC